MRSLTNPWLALLLLVAVAPTQALAYVDPNLGGTLFQWLAPLFALAVVLWSRMKYAVSCLLQKIREMFYRDR